MKVPSMLPKPVPERTHSEVAKGRSIIAYLHANAALVGGTYLIQTQHTLQKPVLITPYSSLNP